MTRAAEELDNGLEGQHPVSLTDSASPPMTCVTSKIYKKIEKYLAEKDHIMVREDAAAHPYVTKYGENCNKYQEAANNVTQNPHMRQPVIWKMLYDLYKCLEDDFDTNDLQSRNLFNIADGETGDLNQMLSITIAERDPFGKDSDYDRTSKSRREKGNERMG